MTKLYTVHSCNSVTVVISTVVINDDMLMWSTAPAGILPVAIGDMFDDISSATDAPGVPH